MTVLVKEDQYLGMLDSLARFYNSQITAHVGYTISITAILAAFVLMLLSTVVLNPSWTTGEWKILVAGFAGILVGLYFLGDFIPYISLPYLYGRTHYYVELSQITWEHMGLTTPFLPGPYLTAIRERAKRMGAQEAIHTMFMACLFISRCVESGKVENETILENLDAFDILEKEDRGVRDFVEGQLHGQNRYYARPLGPYGKLNIRYVNILWLAFKQHVGHTARRDKLLRLQFE